MKGLGTNIKLADNPVIHILVATTSTSSIFCPSAITFSLKPISKEKVAKHKEKTKVVDNYKKE